MASGSNNSKSSFSRSQQQQLVSAMIRQGFIAEPILSPSRLTSVSPPPSFRSPISPTLLEIMSAEPAREPKPSSEAHKKLQEKISDALSQAPFRVSERWGMGDVRLTVAAKVGAGEGETPVFRVSMNVHRRVLAAKSQFFAEKLRRSGTHSVEILDCDDVALYVEVVVLMYCDDLWTKLLGMEVTKILSLLKICSAIEFGDGVRACLDYLEAVPWSEDEEESVVSHLNELHLDGSSVDAVLQRVVAEPSTSSNADEIFMKLSLGVLQGKDDKACRAMRALIFQLLEEDDNNDSFHDRLDISKDTMYSLCHRCLNSLILSLTRAMCLDESRQDQGALMGEIAREVANILWMANILIVRKMGEEFVKLWADQKELSGLHSKIPIRYCHELSKITAQLCISIGKGHLMVSKETRFELLSTWLKPLYDDFRWLRMAGKSFDRKLVEDGLCRTILTLPLPQQQSILLDWFNRFLEQGDDCPNIQGAFEIWWRRAFVKQYEIESHMQLTVCGIPH